MFFSEATLSEIKFNPIEGTIKAIHNAHEVCIGQDWTSEQYDVMIELLALLEELEAEDLIDTEVFIPSVTGVMSDDCAAIYHYSMNVLGILNTKHRLEGLETVRSRFRLNLGKTFAYEFSQGDLDRVQTLISELRENIAAATYFDAAHQQRLLMRLERLQSELHKKVGDLDRFWGLFGDAGVALGKFGTDAKPIFDRINEMTKIVWKTQARSEELPSSAQLPSLEDHSGTGKIV